jgi:hypothetical protein
MSFTSDMVIGYIFLCAWILSFVPQFWIAIKYHEKKKANRYWFICISEIWTIIFMMGNAIYYYDDWKSCSDAICDNYFIGIIPLLELIGSFGLFIILMIKNYKQYGVGHWLLFIITNILLFLGTISAYEIIIQEYTVQVLYVYLNTTGATSLFLILVQYIWEIINVHRIKIVSGINLNHITICSRLILNIAWSLYLIFHYLAEPVVWIPYLLQGCLLGVLLAICLYYLKYTHRYESYRYKLTYEEYI